MTTTTITVRYFAAARAASGVEVDKVQVSSAATVAELLDVLRAEHGPELAQVLARCSYLLDEVAVRDHNASVAGAVSLDVLPPFAGG